MEAFGRVRESGAVTVFNDLANPARRVYNRNCDGFGQAVACKPAAGEKRHLARCGRTPAEHDFDAGTTETGYCRFRSRCSGFPGILRPVRAVRYCTEPVDHLPVAEWRQDAAADQCRFQWQPERVAGVEVGIGRGLDYVRCVPGISDP